MIFTKIKTKFRDIISSKSKCRTILLLFVFVCSFFILSDSVFANSTNNNDAIEKFLLKPIQNVMSFFAGAVGALTGLVIIFLEPSIISGQPLGLNGYIHNIWIFVSNIVYLIFAGFIIVAALANIIGKGDSGIFSLKQFFPKFIVGILIVPFSWYFVQFIISLSTVFAVQVFTWPYNILDETTKNQSKSGSGIMNTQIDKWCKNRVMDFQGSLSGTTSGSGNFVYCEKGQEVSITLKEVIFPEDQGAKPTIGAIMYLYSYQIFEVDNFDKISGNAIGAMKDLTKLSVHSILNLAFFMVYVVLLFAIFVALLVRVVMIWVYTAISPVFGLNHFLSGNGNNGWMGLFGNFTLGNFAKMAFLPVLISGALSFGFMFLMVIGNAYESNKQKIENNSSLQGDEVPPIQLTGNMTLTLKGVSVLDYETGENGERKTLIKSLAGSKNLAGYLIIKLLGLAFLWFVVMAALKSTEITEKVSTPFRDFGKQAFEGAKRLPLVMPIPGTSFLGGKDNKQNFSLGDIKTVSRDFGNNFERLTENSERGQDLGKEIAKRLGLKVNDYTGRADLNDKELEEFKKLIKDPIQGRPSKDQQETMRKISSIGQGNFKREMTNLGVKNDEERKTLIQNMNRHGYYIGRTNTDNYNDTNTYLNLSEMVNNHFQSRNENERKKYKTYFDDDDNIKNNIIDEIITNYGLKKGIESNFDRNIFKGKLKEKYKEKLEKEGIKKEENQSGGQNP